MSQLAVGVALSYLWQVRIAGQVFQDSAIGGFLYVTCSPRRLAFFGLPFLSLSLSMVLCVSLLSLTHTHTHARDPHPTLPLMHILDDRGTDGASEQLQEVRRVTNSFLGRSATHYARLMMGWGKPRYSSVDSVFCPPRVHCFNLSPCDIMPKIVHFCLSFGPSWWRRKKRLVHVDLDRSSRLAEPRRLFYSRSSTLNVG